MKSFSKFPMILTLVLIQVSGLPSIGQQFTASNALALLSPANHLTKYPVLSATPSQAEKNAHEMYQQQLNAIDFIRSNKIVAAIPNLIMYLDYARLPGVGHMALGPDLGNAEKNYVAFGALIKMPESATALKDYCLDNKQPLEYRLAALFTLKFVNQQMFGDCWSVFKASSQTEKENIYLDYMKTQRAQFRGVLPSEAFR